MHHGHPCIQHQPSSVVAAGCARAHAALPHRHFTAVPPAPREPGMRCTASPCVLCDTRQRPEAQTHAGSAPCWRARTSRRWRTLPGTAAAPIDISTGRPCVRRRCTHPCGQVELKSEMKGTNLGGSGVNADAAFRPSGHLPAVRELFHAHMHAGSVQRSRTRSCAHTAASPRTAGRRAVGVV